MGKKSDKFLEKAIELSNEYTIAYIDIVFDDNNKNRLKERRLTNDLINILNMNLNDKTKFFQMKYFLSKNKASIDEIFMEGDKKITKIKISDYI